MFSFLHKEDQFFKFVQFSHDGIHYKARDGDFYLPKAIIFYDALDYNFPTAFYFIAQIGQQLEIRFVKGGADAQWFHVAEMHQAVFDQEVISKI
ncbi:MAG: hypothetical protein H7Z20_06260 [Bdellovibrio sp.]|nr:hypothetical protein [Methylotenera sp.]